MPSEASVACWVQDLNLGGWGNLMADGYNYSAPYRGISSVLPSGALEAMTAPGRNIGRGLEQVGEGIASMIQRYQQTKAERDLASGELEGLISQYIPQAQGLPTGETGGVDLGQFGKIVGENNVKKFVEGKASTADMLAMAHSIKTAQAEKDKALQNEMTNLQIDQLRSNQFDRLKAQENEKKMQQAIRFAVGNQNQPDIGNLGKPGDTTVGVSPVPYEQARMDLAKYMSATNAPPEHFAALDNILAIANKKQPMQVATQQLPGNLGTVVTAGGKTEILKPDPSLQARVIPGFTGVVPTEKEAIDFRQLQSDSSSSKDIIDQLLKLTDTPGATMRPELRAQGKALSQQLVGKLRTAVLGPGTINESERAILESLAANPATIFSMDSKTKASLNTLKGTLDRAVFDRAKSLGLNPADQQAQSQGGLPRVKFNPALVK